MRGVAADVATAEGRAALLAAVGAAFGGQLDALFNNVGTNIRKPTVEYSAADFQSLVSTNLESAFALSRGVHPLLKAAGGGVIVMNSSVAGGPTSMRSGSIYAMTKAAMVGWWGWWARRWPGHMRGWLLKSQLKLCPSRLRL